MLHICSALVVRLREGPAALASRPATQAEELDRAVLTNVNRELMKTPPSKILTMMAQQNAEEYLLPPQRILSLGLVLHAPFTNMIQIAIVIAVPAQGPDGLQCT